MSPKVGDTVIIEGVVIEVITGGFFKFKTDCGSCPAYVSRKHIKDIIPGPPPEPKVGDTVWYDGVPDDGGTLLFIHQEEGDNRKFAVVAYRGDIPRSFSFDKVRLTR